jgi:hypothetical protein
MIWLLKKGRSRQSALAPKCHGITAVPSAMARSLACPKWAPTQITQCTACARLTTTPANQPSCTTQARHSAAHELALAPTASGFCRLGSQLSSSISEVAGAALNDLTWDFCTGGSEREFWRNAGMPMKKYKPEQIVTLLPGRLKWRSPTERTPHRPAGMLRLRPRHSTAGWAVGNQIAACRSSQERICSARERRESRTFRRGPRENR